MDSCAEKCVFVGYGITQKGYRCYNPKTRHMFTTMNCVFLETKYYYASQHSGQGETECIDILSWLRYVTYEKGRNHSTQNESPFSTQPEDPNISVTQEAPNLIHAGKVRVYRNKRSHQGKVRVYNKRYLPLKKTHPKDILPPRANRGVRPKRYSLEKESRGSRYPMDNIAKGNPSKEAKPFALSLYFDEILANMEQALKSKHWKDAMEEEMKALTTNNTWEKRVLQLGKKIIGCQWVFTIKYKPDGTIERYKARLLKEEVYMEAPHGLTDSFREKEVCLLKKSLYGLKHSPRAWFGKFTLAMKHYGFRQRNDKEKITKLKKNLFTEFEMKDLGRLKYFLKIEVLRSKEGIFMYQKKNVLDLLA
ncbi:putative ribonuclease H-like domain-containing protein [Tanacetum coccineum]